MINTADKFIKNNANLSPLIKISPSANIKTIVIKNNINLFAKAIAHVDTNGQIHTQVMSGQESFKVKPFRDANCWAMIPEGVETIQKGEQISIFPLSQDRNIDF